MSIKEETLMGYDITLRDRNNNKIGFTPEHSAIISCGYSEDDAYQNSYVVTYNYNDVFRLIYQGNTLKDVLDDMTTNGAAQFFLKKGIEAIGDCLGPDSNYYAPTPGNVKVVLEELLELADKHPNCHFRFD